MNDQLREMFAEILYPQYIDPSRMLGMKIVSFTFSIYCQVVELIPGQTHMCDYFFQGVRGCICRYAQFNFNEFFQNFLTQEKN